MNKAIVVALVLAGVLLTGGGTVPTWESNVVLEREVLGLERKVKIERQKAQEMKTAIEELDHTVELLLKEEEGSK